MIDDATIETAVELVRRATPRATVLLFGSYARGDAHDRSDLDLLVIEPKPLARRMEAARLRAVLRPLGVPVDLLVVNEESFREWRQTPGMIVDLPPREGRSYAAVDFGILIPRFLADAQPTSGRPQTSATGHATRPSANLDSATAAKAPR
jgi:predicted nucleotidyltransferase